MPKGTCTTLGCGRVELCKGLCNRCYQRVRYRAKQDAKPKRVAHCRRCGAQFEQYNSQHVHCTDTCRNAEKHARRRARRRVGKSLRCDYCGAALPARKRSDTRWCSPKCSDLGDYALNAERYKADARQWRLDNNDAARAYDKAYRRANQKKIQARQTMWIAANRTRHAAYQREYHRRWLTPDRARRYKHARRAREYGNPGSVGVPLREWLRLVNRHGGRCAYCDARPERLHMDHIIPLARGGRHAIGNVLPACQRCNQTKAARLLIEWRLGRSALRPAG